MEFKCHSIVDWIRLCTANDEGRYGKSEKGRKWPCKEKIGRTVARDVLGEEPVDQKKIEREVVCVCEKEKENNAR